MSLTNKNAELKELLSRFFEEGHVLEDHVIELADAFLFQDAAIEQVEVSEEMMNTLVYLKDVIARNNCKNVQDLRHYYAKKHQKIDELADLLERSAAEERFAICVHEAFAMYLQPIRPEHDFKSVGIFFKGPAGQHLAMEFDNISYRHSVEEEKAFLSSIHGNVLIRQHNKAAVTDTRLKKIMSN